MFLFCDAAPSRSSGSIRTGPWRFGGSTWTRVHPEDSNVPGYHLRLLPLPVIIAVTHRFLMHILNMVMHTFYDGEFIFKQLDVPY